MTYTVLYVLYLKIFLNKINFKNLNFKNSMLLFKSFKNLMFTCECEIDTNQVKGQWAAHIKSVKIVHM